MLIKKIIFKNDLIYNDIEFDFCDVNGLPFKTIILAGENGTGKSYLLNVIHNFFHYQPGHEVTTTGTVTFILHPEEHELKIIREIVRDRLAQNLPSNIADLRITQDRSKPNDWSCIQASFVYINEVGSISAFNLPIYVISQSEISNLFQSIFTDVEVNYTPKQIATVTNLDVDTFEKKTVKSDENLATMITQLLIDIESIDNSDYTRWARENPGKLNTDGVTDVRMRRFKNAFNYMFPSKRFDKIINFIDGKRVMFKDQDKEMSINELSSGEKQIVFRGSFILKDQLKRDSGIVLVDEPELSLHPKWQLKILDYYKKLISDSEGEQKLQLFVTTHSPFIIHNESSDQDKIIILTKTDQNIVVEENPEFFSWTKQEAILQAFDVKLNYENDKLIVFVEGETDEKYIQLALKLYSKEKWPVLVQWIGRKDIKMTKFTGDTALKQTRDYLLANSDLHKNKFLLLYDSDTKVNDEDYTEANLFVRRAPVNENNTLYKIGIENLLTLPEDFEKDIFINVKEKIDDYGVSSTIRTLNKIKLCDWICSELCEEDQKFYLNEINEQLLSIIESLLFPSDK